MLTEQEIERIVNQGNAAKRLLEDPDFIEVMNALGDFHLAAMTACPPGPRHADTRDHHHTMLHALREVVDETKSRAAALDDFRAHQREDQEDTE